MRRRALSASLAAALLVLGGAWILSSRPAAPGSEIHLAPTPAPPDLLADVDRLRQIRAARRVSMGGTDDLEYAQVLDRVREGSARALFYLQVIALRRAENVSLRIDLLNVVARHREEETRTFLSLLVVDSSQDPAVRIAALERLMKYQDDATFEVLKSAWLDPAPFEGRYHLCRAFGENGRPGGVPLLRGALAPERPPDIRCHAALGLGGFVGDAGVRAELKALALSDADPAVRQNAIRSLGRSTDPDVDGFLRDLAASGATDAETKRVAWALLQQRARNP